MVQTILVIVVISVIGVSVLAYRNRSERGIESGISSFRRELRALAPENEGPPRANGPRDDPPRTSGVGILRDGPAELPDDGDQYPTAEDDDGFDPPDEPGRGR